MNEPYINVLFVEDDKIDQLALERTFRPKNIYRYQIISSIKEAYQYLVHKQYDIIVTDYMLDDVHRSGIN